LCPPRQQLRGERAGIEPQLPGCRVRLVDDDQFAEFELEPCQRAQVGLALPDELQVIAGEPLFGQQGVNQRRVTGLEHADAAVEGLDPTGHGRFPLGERGRRTAQRLGQLDDTFADHAPQVFRLDGARCQRGLGLGDAPAGRVVTEGEFDREPDGGKRRVAARDRAPVADGRVVPDRIERRHRRAGDR
jgi:hypothetical protein